MKNVKPFVFIGSSTEGLRIAKSLQSNLQYTCESQIWSQGLFGLSQGTLESLVNSLNTFDFAILVLTNDDVTVSRGKETSSPRDNVLFELGLFMGALGRDRTFIVSDRSTSLKMPSDLAGITISTFVPPEKGTLSSSLGPVSTAIEECIEKIGPKHPSLVEAWWWTNCQEDGYSLSSTLSMTVTNRSDRDIPWLNVHVFPSNTFILTPRSEKRSQLLSHQYIFYDFNPLDEDGKLTNWAEMFLQSEPGTVSIRIFKDSSVEEPVLISYDLGEELRNWIKHWDKT